VPYHDLVDDLVVRPAGLTHTAFLRSDELPGDAAIGYLDAEGLRTNLLHLPVRGVGDGGISTTAADVSRLWASLFAGTIVSPGTVALMTAPHSPDTGTKAGERYGLGCWLPATDGLVEMEGADAGASFRSTHRPADGRTVTVLSNTTDGAWPVLRAL
jgi:CubicO group peptidase (beta-lactamase class C family)